MSKQNVLDLDKALKKSKMTLAKLHRELVSRGIPITYHTLQNYKGRGSGSAPSAFKVLNEICDILETTPDKLLK